MIKLDVSNFRLLRDVHFHDENKLSVIVGYNEAGKSSLTGAIQWILTGTAYGLKGSDCDSLMTDGETRMYGRLQIGPHFFVRTKSGGDTLKEIAAKLGVPTDVLPLLFHQEMNGDGGSKHLRAFLSGAVADSFNAPSYFAKDPELKPRIDKALATGAKTTKQIVAFCEAQRAACKPPPRPVMPDVVGLAEPDFRQLKADLESARADCATAKKQLDDTSRLFTALQAERTYLEAMATYEVAKAASSVSDPLGSRREALSQVLALNTQSVMRIGSILLMAGFNDREAVALNNAIVTARGAAAKLLADNPPTVNVAKPEGIAEADRQLIAPLSPSRDNIDTILRLVATQRLSDIRTSEEKKTKFDELSKKYDKAQQAIGAWEAYRQAEPAWEDARAATEVEWQRWDNAAKTIAAAETLHIQKAGSEFEQLITDISAKILNGRRISVSVVDGIRLNGRPMSSESTSTRWRIEVSIMAAVALYLKSPIFLIDGADILDTKNMESFTDFILTQIVPHFSHTILTATCRGDIKDEKPLSAGVTKWLMIKGELSRLAAA